MEGWLETEKVHVRVTCQSVCILTILRDSLERITFHSYHTHFPTDWFQGGIIISSLALLKYHVDNKTIHRNGKRPLCMLIPSSWSLVRHCRTC